MPDAAVVVGGGLASIDVVKLLNIEVFARALRERGIEVDAMAMEHAGIAETARHTRGSVPRNWG